MRLNIEAERVRKRLTKEEFAKCLKVSVKTYYNWLNEETDIPGTKLVEMANLFGTTMEYLMESIPDEKSDVRRKG